MSSKEKSYKVSIRLMTYMHEPYIKQAMDSVMEQEANFNIEVVVGDDFSTDQTLEIIKTYKDTENIHIKILNREKGDEYWQKRQKLGRLCNFTNILDNCSGVYIALLDGDDYWTDPLKLQKQVDFLEANPDYGICAHKTLQSNQNSGVDMEFPKIRQDEDFTLQDFIQANRIGTCSIVYKSNLFKALDWHTKSPFGDWLLTLSVMHNSNHKIRVFSSVMSLYRMHDGGIHGSLHQNKYKLSLAYQQHLRFINLIQKELLYGKFKKTILKKKITTSQKIKSLIFKKKQPFRFLKYQLLTFLYSIKLKFYSSYEN